MRFGTHKRLTTMTPARRAFRKKHARTFARLRAAAVAKHHARQADWPTWRERHRAEVEKRKPVELVKPEFEATAK